MPSFFAFIFAVILACCTEAPTEVTVSHLTETYVKIEMVRQIIGSYVIKRMSVLRL